MVVIDTKDEKAIAFFYLAAILNQTMQLLTNISSSKCKKSTIETKTNTETNGREVGVHTSSGLT